MKMAETHPWLSGPAELISYALKHFQDKDNKDFNRRIAFLLLDIGVETLFKTFLTLPEDVTHAETEYHRRRKAANGNFHDLIIGIKAAASSRLKDDVLSHIEFYHNIRNNLYHQGSGITVTAENVHGYAKEATYLLKTLLGVDLTDNVVLAPDILKELTNQANKLDSVLNQLPVHVRLVIEKIEPKLLLPSVVNKLHALSVDVNIHNFQDKLDTFIETIETSVGNEEMRKWILNLIATDVLGSSSQAIANAKFLFDMLDDLISFYLLIIGAFVLPDGNIEKEFLYSEEDLTIVDDQEYHIVGLYSGAKFFQSWHNPINCSLEPSAISNIIEHRKKRAQQIDKLIESLRNWLNNN